MEMKTEVDNSNITECTHDDVPDFGRFGSLVIFLSTLSLSCLSTCRLDFS